MHPDSVLVLQADLLLALARLGRSQEVDVSALSERVRSILADSGRVASGVRQRIVGDLARVRALTSE